MEHTQSTAGEPRPIRCWVAWVSAVNVRAGWEQWYAKAAGELLSPPSRSIRMVCPLPRRATAGKALRRPLRRLGPLRVLLLINSPLIRPLSPRVEGELCANLKNVTA